MKPGCKSVALVALQLASIGYLIVSGPVYVRINQPFWLGMEIAGLVLAVWAVATMKPRHLRAVPEVAEGARLVTSGPYRFIRHPMYLAVLLACGALVGNQAGLGRLIVFGLLLVVFAVKSRYEETLLARRFPEYAAYQRRTWRLVPFLY